MRSTRMAITIHRAALIAEFSSRFVMSQTTHAYRQSDESACPLGKLKLSMGW